MTLIRNPQVTTEPVSCPPAVSDPPNPPNPPSGDAFACLPPSGSLISGKLHKQYYQGYRQFGIDTETGDFSASDVIFQPLADIHQSDLAVMDEKCRNFTEGARAFVRGATGTHTEGRPDSDRSNYNPNTWTKPDLITLLPNPASSEVVVKLAPGMQSFRVLNAVGSLMVFQPASGAYQYLDVHNWPAGLYIVEGLGKDKIDNPRVKLIIE